MTEWFCAEGIDKIVSPGLLVYPLRVVQNIDRLIARVHDVSCLRPHVKTNKMPEVCRLMLQKGITKFKCATIAEAEMLGELQAPDVLLAYQPVGPNLQRFLQLCKTYAETRFSCLVDNLATLQLLAEAAESQNITAYVFIDLNVGMHRTGICPEDAMALIEQAQSYRFIKLLGLHGYDGHVNDTDITVRQQKSDEGFSRVAALRNEVETRFNIHMVVVAGGSPSFATHAMRAGVECSPGTFVFWDWGYMNKLPQEPYEFAALVISRVISIIDKHTICTDLGHKSVAAENPLPRVYFLNATDTKAISQSEEHLVLQVPDSSAYKVGQVLYGVPVHICPTVALYDEATVVQNGKVDGKWAILGRRRKITI